ncbi:MULTISPECIES: NAD(P)-dependent oxidoreductase [Marinobacter]|uniref:SDR family oxidoreductase n=1 Tax=Marinobacter metalliresistant TaxID=2961995 RepID=A0ABZ2W5W5_9GAMM|nr:NAD(P)-binding oxidoreductase [Marinobacter sp. Arc7-DN-1]AXS82858.1 NAD(P)-dependent oxidoreductase [Marinobacter sp. Arc7-DN-1]
MTVLVVGATGATGRLLVEQLLELGNPVRAVARAPEKLPQALIDHPALSVIHGSILDFSDDQIRQHVDGCSAVASCLGHNLTFKGMYGSPRWLVTDTLRRLCEAIRASRPSTTVRVVLMNTAGNSHPEESPSFAEACVVGLIRVLVPPHADNEKAAEYLSKQVTADDPALEWVAVRPDTLIDEDQATTYDVVPSPTRSAIFNAGKTSRINVAHFMAELISSDETWQQWKGRMPVIYNR